MPVQNISPFRYSTFNTPCQITQVAGALYPEEGEKDFIWLGPHFCIENARHAGCRKIIIRITHLRVKSTSVALAGQ